MRHDRSIYLSLLFIVLAIVYTLEFNWHTWALSDLGVHQAALIFNSGLMIGGILTTVFAAAMMRVLSKRILGSAGAFFLVLSAISLFAIGVFPESAGRIHLIVSVTFFAFLALSLLIVGVAFLTPLERDIAIFSLLLGAVAAFAWAIPHEGAAIPEIIASLAGSIWSIILAIKFFLNI